MVPFGTLDIANVRAESSVIFACATSESGTVRRYAGVCADAVVLCVYFFVLSIGVGLWAAATPTPSTDASRTAATVFMVHSPFMVVAPSAPTSVGVAGTSALSNERPARV